MSKPLEELMLGALLDAEGQLLKSHAGALLDQVGLTRENLTTPRVRVAWGIVQRLVDRRRPVDASTVFAAGRSTKAFADPDLEWLLGLQAGNALDRDRFASVAEEVRGRQHSANLVGVLRRNLEALEDPGANLAHVAADLELALSQLTEASTDDGSGEDDVIELADDWQRTEEGRGPPPLLPTGIASLDAELAGLPPNLSTIIGLPSVGKSALLGSIVDAQLDLGIKVGLFGLEDGTRWLVKRIIAREMGMAVRDVGAAKRTSEQAALFQEVAARIAGKMRNLITYKHDTITTAEMVRRSSHWIANRGVQAIYVDHGGEVDHSTDRFDEYRLKVAESYRKFRNVARRYSTPVVVLAHTARVPDEEERPPRMNEIAESAAIERRCRVIIGVWRRMSEPDWMRATILKQTEGPPGATVRLARLTTAALIDRAVGEPVNLEAERRREAKEVRERKAAESVARREAVKVAAAAVKAPKKGQLSLVTEADDE